MKHNADSKITRVKELKEKKINVHKIFSKEQKKNILNYQGKW